MGRKVKRKDIQGKYSLKVKAGGSEPIEDLMLFGKNKYELAHDVVTGKLNIETFMNEWYRRYTEDLA